MVATGTEYQGAPATMPAGSGATALANLKISVPEAATASSSQSAGAVTVTAGLVTPISAETFAQPVVSNDSSVVPGALDSPSVGGAGAAGGNGAISRPDEYGPATTTDGSFLAPPTDGAAVLDSVSPQTFDPAAVPGSGRGPPSPWILNTAGAVAIVISGSDLEVTAGGVTTSRPLSSVSEVSVTGGGLATLTGPASDTNWYVTGPNSGTLDGLQFSGIANLVGGAADDQTFFLSHGASVSGRIDGGGIGTIVINDPGGSLISDAVDHHSGTLILDGAPIVYVGMAPIIPDVGIVDISDTGGNLTVQLDTTTPTDLDVSGSGIETHMIPIATLISLSIEAKTITFNGSIPLLPLTTLTVTGSDTNNGTSTSTGIIPNANPDAEITLNSAQITAGQVTLTATATTTPDTSSTPFGVANIESSPIARILLNGSSSIVTTGHSGTTNGNVAISATTSETAKAVTDGTGGASSSVDAAVAETTINSKAIAGISGTSYIQASGTLAIAANNTTNVTTSGDASKATAGAGIAVAIVSTQTLAYIDANGANPTSATSITITASTTDTDTTTAKASPGGSSQNKDSHGNDDSPNTKTNGNANVTDQNTKSSQSIPIAAALAFTDFSDDTEAYIAGTNTIQSPSGSLTITATAGNSVPTSADGSTVKSSGAAADSVGVGVAIGIDSLTQKAHIGGTNHLETPIVTVTTAMPASGTTQDAYSATAVAGAGDASKLTVAGALGLTILTVDREATLGGAVDAGSADNSTHGSLTFSATSNATATAKATSDDQVFDPKKSGVISGNVISLPYQIKNDSGAAIANGAKLDYSADGDTPIGGLADGGQYYAENVHTTSGGGMTLQLAKTASDATSGATGINPLPLDPTVATGDSHSLKLDGGVNGVGIGASVAIDIVNDTTTAALADGATLNNANNLTLTSTATDAMTTEAENGAAGAEAIVPSVAISISNVTTNATVGTGGTLTLFGALDAEATQTASVATTARGDISASTAGIGASIAITDANHTVTATTNRNLTVTGAITFKATGASGTDSETRASVTGASASSDGSSSSNGQNVNGQADSQLSGANGAASHNGAHGSTDSSTPSASTADSGGSGSGGSSSIGVAAAVSFNLVHATANASLPEGLTISAGGLLTLASSGNDDATANADGEAATQQGTASVGAAVAINLAHVNNTANITAGDGISSKGLTLGAAMGATGTGGSETTPTHTFLASATSGAQGSTTANLNGSLALNIIDVNTSAALLGPAHSRGPPTVNANNGDVSMTGISATSSTTKALAANQDFDPNAAGVITATGTGTPPKNTIHLSQALTTDSGDPIANGADLIYHDGGGTPIGGLTDGTHYFAVVVKPGYYELATTSANATASTPTVITLDPTKATGTGHSLEFNGSDPKVGIGASVAINLVNDNTQTGMIGDGTAADGATLTGAHDVSISSTASDSVSTDAEGGAAGGVAISPSVAVSIPNVTTSATFGAGPTLTTTGKIEVSAKQDADLDSAAKGDFNGSKVGIGISLSIAVPTYDVTATSARSLTSGTTSGDDDISFTADGAARVNAETEAAGEGETSSTDSSGTKDSSGNGHGGSSENVNQKADSQLSSAESTQSTNSGHTSSTTSTPAATDGDNGSASLSFAAAVTINIVNTSVTASLTPGITVNAGGKLTLKSTANTDGLATANGDTKTNASVGIGAAVSINLVTIVNQATTGGATVTANGIDVEAGIDTNATDPVYEYDPTAVDKSWQLVQSGAELPTSPDDGDYFQLTEKSGIYNPGVYKYTASSKTWGNSPTINQVDALPSTAPTTLTFDRAAAHQIYAVSTSGASAGTSVVVAGSLAMNIVTNQTQALLASGGSTVTDSAGTGDLALSANSDEVDLANAKATADGASEKKKNGSQDSSGGSGSGSTDSKGNSVGVGASVALNILTSENVRAEIQDGVAVTNAAAVSLTATSTRLIQTNVEAGTKGTSISVSPAVSLVVLTNDAAVARIGTAGSTLNATGAVTITATHSIDASGTEGSADAAGSKVAVGADISINVLTGWSTTAELARNLSGASLSLAANSTVDSEASTKASAKGSSSSDSSADSKANGQVANNPNTNNSSTGNLGSPSNTLPSAGSNTSSANSSASGQSGNSGGGVGVAAAISVNFVSATNTADLVPGITVTATAGAVSVQASDQNTAASRAIGLSYNLSSSGSDADIAAAVSINDAQLTNTATIGTNDTVSSAGTGAGITVAAIVPAGAENDFIVWGIGGSGGKSQVSVSASVGVQVINDQTTASVGAGSTLTSAGGLTVNATDPIGLQNLALSGALSINGDGVGGAISVNVIDSDTTKAYIDSGTTAGTVTSADIAGATAVTATTSLSPLGIDLSKVGISSSKLNKLAADLKLSSVAIGAGASSGDAAVTGSFVVDVFNFDTEAYVAGGARVNQINHGGSGQTVNVAATDTTRLIDIAGGLALTTGDAGVGIGVVVEVLDFTTKAAINGGALVSAGGDIGVAANSSESLTAFGVEISGSSGAVAASGSVVVAVINPDGGTGTSAEIGAGATVAAGGNLSVSAADTTPTLLLVTGQLSVGDSAGVGLASTTLVRSEDVDAGIGSGANVSALGSTGMTISASQHAAPTDIAVGGSVGGTAGVSGSVTVEVFNDTTNAHIDSGALINCTGSGCANTGASSTQGVAVTASDTSTIFDTAGAVAVGGSAGVGAGVDVQVLNKTTTASIGSSAKVKASGEIVDTATSSEKDTSLALGVAVGGSAGVSVNAGVSVIHITTQAWIGSGAQVVAGDSVDVGANEGLTLTVIAGNIAVGGAAGIGAGASVPIVTKTTEAWIDTNADVIGLGGGSTGVTVFAGSFNVAPNDPRFAPSDAIEGDHATINLAADDPGYVDGFMEGQAVRYDAGGGAQIIGLTNGDTYYVHVVSDHEIQLSTSSGGAILTGLSTPSTCAGSTAHSCGGENQRFVGSDQATEASDSSPRFTPSSDVSGNTIDLPYAPDFSDGDTVVYSSGGGTPIGNLTDGAQYTAHSVGTNAWELEDSNGNVITLNAGAATGRSHSLVKKGDSPSDDASAQNQPTVSGNSTTHFHGVAVTAANSDNIAAAGFSGAIGGSAGVALSGAVNVVTATTKAYIGAGAHVNCDVTDASCTNDATGSNSAQSVDVAAADTFQNVGIAASLAIGGAAGVAPGASVRVATLTTDAYVDNSALVHAQNSIAIVATGSESLVAVAAGAAGGTVGVAATATVTVVHMTTDAYTGTGVTLASAGSVLVSSSDATKIVAVAGTVAGGFVGVSAGVDVVSFTKDTEAYVGGSSQVSAGAGGVSIQSATEENVFGLAVAIGGGFVGVAGAVEIALPTVTTKAFIGPSTSVTSGGSVSVSASDAIKTLTIGGGVAGGFVGVGGGVDVGVLDETIQAYIGSGANVSAGGDVNVEALSNKDINTYAVGLAGGLVGVSGAVSVWTIGTETTSTYNQGAGGINRGNWQSGTAYQSGDVVTYNGQTYAAKADNPNTSATPDSNPSQWQANENALSGGSGGAASDGDSTASGQGSGGYMSVLSGVGSSAPDPNNRIGSTLTNANGQLAGSQPSGSLVSSTLGQATPPQGTSAEIYGTVVAGGNVLVEANDGLNLVGLAGAIAGGLVGVGAGILVTNIEGNTDAGIAGTGNVSAGSGSGSVTVSVNATETVNDLAIAGAVGAVGIGGAIAVVNDSATQTAHIDDGASLPAAGNGVFVSATTTRTTSAFTPEVSIGLVAAGAAVATVTVTGDDIARIGDVTVGSSSPVGQVSVQATDHLNPSTEAISISAGVVGLAGAAAWTDLSGQTLATSGAHGSVGSGGMTVAASGDHSNIVAKTLNVSAGAVAGGVTIRHAEDDRATVAATTASSTPNAGLSTTGAVTVTATATNGASAVDLGASVSIGAITISAVYGLAEVGGATRVSLNGSVTSSSSITAIARANDSAFAPVKQLGASIIGVGGVYGDAEVTSGAGIEALVGSGASLASSGGIDIEALTQDAAHNPVTTTATATATGVSITLITLTVLVTRALVDNDVKATLDGRVTSSGAITVNANGSDSATATTTTVSIGIGVAISGAGASADVGQNATTDATAAGTSSLTSSGNIAFSATSHNQANASSDGGTGGFVAVGIELPTATVDGATNAAIGGAVSGSTGSVSASASSANQATSHSFVVAVGVYSGGGSAADATISPTAATTSCGGIFAAGACGAGGAWNTPNAAVSFSATSANASHAAAKGDSVGVISVSIMKTDAEVQGPTLAGFDASLNSGAGLAVQATGHNLAVADTGVLSIGIGFTAAAPSSNADITSAAKTEARVGSTAHINVSGQVFVSSGLGSGANDGKCADGSVSCTCTTTGGSCASAASHGGNGGIISAGIYSATGKAEGDAIAELDGTITSAGNVIVQATGASDAEAQTTTVGVGGVSFTADISDAEVTNGAVTNAIVGGGAQITATNVGGSCGPDAGTGVCLNAGATNTANASSDGASVGLVGAGGGLPAAVINAPTGSYFYGTVNAAPGVTLAAVSTNRATAVSSVLTIGLVSAQDSAALACIGNSTSSGCVGGNAVTEAIVEGGAQLGHSDSGSPSITGQVALTAKGDNAASASATGNSAGLISLNGGTDPTAIDASGTDVQLNGNVGDGAGAAGAGSVALTAGGADVTTAKVETLTVGLIASGPSTATATTTPTISAQIGNGHVIAANDVSLISSAHTDADSYSKSTGAGGINLQSLSTETNDFPTVNASVNGGLVQAGGNITISATHGGPAITPSDGTITQVNGNTLTFNGKTGLNTGQTVTYQGNGPTGTTTGAIGGLVNGDTYGVIVTGDTTTELGVVFTFGAQDNHTGYVAGVDAATGSLHFNISPNLHTGDVVTYNTNGGAAISAVIGGAVQALGSGPYTVIAFDSKTIRLRDSSASTKEVSFKPSAAITGGSLFTVSNSFSNGDAVTYHAPQVAEFDGTQDVAGGEINIPATYPFTGNTYTFSTGDQVVYGCTDTPGSGSACSPSVGGLANGHHYLVVGVDGSHLKLHDLSDTGNPSSTVGVTPGGSGIQTLTPVDGAISGLTDGDIYYVVSATAATFKLSKTLNGTPLTGLSGGGNGTDHLEIDAVDLVSNGSGDPSFVLNLGSDPGGTQVMLGVGGASALIGGAGDEEPSSSSSGVGGGAVSVATAGSDENTSVHVNTTIGSGSTLTGTTIIIAGASQANGAATADDSGGGLVSVGNSHANANAANLVITQIAAGATVTGSSDVSVFATSVEQPQASSHVGGGGAYASAHATANSTSNHTDLVELYGTTTAGRTLLAEGREGFDGHLSVSSDAGGLGASSHSDDGGQALRIGSGGGACDGVTTLSSQSSGAGCAAAGTIVSGTLSGQLIYLSGQTGVQHYLDSSGVVQAGNLPSDLQNSVTSVNVNGVNANPDATSSSDAVGADSNATAEIDVSEVQGVELDASANLTAASIELHARAENQTFHAHADAFCGCGGGAANADTPIAYHSESLIDAAAGAALHTSALLVDLVNTYNYTHDHNAHGGAFVDHNSCDFDCGGSANNSERTTHWNATTYLVGAANPLLTIDQNGTITAKSANVTVYDGAPGGGASGPVGVGYTFASGHSIIVAPLSLTGQGVVLFKANSGGPASTIDSTDGSNDTPAQFVLQDTWDSVTITNQSDRVMFLQGDSGTHLAVNTLNTSLGTTSTPIIDISIDQGAQAGGSFDFGVRHLLSPTTVVIKSARGPPTTGFPMIFQGGIYNPIGSTTIENDRGDIITDTTAPFTSNALHLAAIGGSIGCSTNDSTCPDGGNTDQPLSAVLIQYATGVSGSPVVHAPVLDGEALDDINLVLTTVERDSPTSSSGVITPSIGALHAGRNIVLDVRDSQQGTTGPSTGGAINVARFVPNAVPSTPFSPGATGVPAETVSVIRHFRPDPSGATIQGCFEQGNTCVDDAYAAIGFGSDQTPMPSEYDFTDLTAGNDIYVHHDSTATRMILSADTAVDATFVDGAGQTVGSNDGVGNISLFTNGSVFDTETRGDLRVGQIIATGNCTGSATACGTTPINADVTLRSPAAVLNAAGDGHVPEQSPTATGTNVIGRSINITAGNNGTTGGSFGGVGTPDLFLTVQVNADGPDSSGDGGLLTVTDTAASRAFYDYTSSPVTDNAPSFFGGTYGVFVTQTNDNGSNGNLDLNTVTTNGDAALTTTGGSIFDARTPAVTGTEPAPNVVADSVDLNAIDGAIGSPFGSNDLKVHSSAGSECLVSTGTSEGASVTAGCRLNAQAADGIHITEASGTPGTSARADLLYVYSTTGDVTITAADSGTTGNDIRVLKSAQNGGSGYTLFASNAPQAVAGGEVEAADGNVTLIAPDDLLTDPTSTISSPVENTGPGTTTLEGGQANRAGSHILVQSTYSAGLTEIYGGNGGDFITLVPTAVTGYTQVHGGTLGDTITLHLPSIDTSDITTSGSDPTDLVNGTAAQTTTENRTVQGLTLPLRDMVDVDGQAGSDIYNVELSGVTTADPNGTSYVVNLHDTGPSTDADSLNVVLPIAQANDLIVRSNLIALVHPQSGADAAGPYTADYERINYDSSVDSLTAFGGSKGDHYYFVDNAVPTTVFGGDGGDSYRFGGLFGAAPTAPSETATGDAINTVKTTAGYLSPGISFATTVFGGTGEDSFLVYSNRAPLTIDAGSGDTTVQTRGFDPVAGGAYYDAHVILTGAGHTSLDTIGTVADEPFAISSTQVLGGGMYINYSGVKLVEVNGNGGNDTFTVLSTVAGAITELEGGISGSDTFNIADDVVTAVAADTTPTSGIPVIPNPSVGPHQTVVLGGPLVIDGGVVTPPDLLQSVRLPTELDAALTPLPAQTSNLNRVATLNVFDDLNASGQTGGLGDISANQLAALQALFAGDDFATMPTADFGEISGLGTSTAQSLAMGTLTTPSSLSVDGGIVFGSVDIVDTLLGTGNDTFTVTDTVQNVINLVQGGGGTNDLVAKGGGGYFSPLLLFGGTSQNGQYYNSTSTHLTGWAREFSYPTSSAYPATTLDASLDFNTVILYGGAGAAQIYGGGGGDQIAGGSGDDNIYAGQGNDIIHANDGFNVDLTHSLPQDLNNGLPGLIVTNEPSQSDFPSSDPLNPISDFIYGGIGHDIVFMVHGQVDQFASAITGPSNVFDAYTVDPVSFGLSFFFGGYGASTIVFAGSGQQSIDVHHTNQANIVIKNGFVDFSEPDGWISHLAKIGSSSPGSGGNDTIQTGNGNDYIVAGTGFDKITGGDGNKIVLGDDGFVKWAGTLLVEIASQDPGVSQDSTFANTITLGNGNDIVIGGSGANRITVGNGNDIIGGANDELDFDAQGRYSTFESVFPTFGMNNAIVAGTGTGIIIGGDGQSSISAGANYAIAPRDGAGTYDPATGRWTITSNYIEIQTPTGPVVVPTPPPTVAPIVTPPPVKPKPKPKPKPKKKPKKKKKGKSKKKKKGKKGKSKKKKKKGKSKKKKTKKKKKSKPKKHTSKSKG